MKIGDKVQCIKLEWSIIYLKKYFTIIGIDKNEENNKYNLLHLKAISVVHQIPDINISLYQYKLKKISNFDYIVLKLKGIVK